jgi:hypothetical protein
MKNSQKPKSDRTSSESAANHEKICQLKAHGIPISFSWDEDGVVIDAYVTSAQATRLLAPLGADAIGKFWVLPDNMVAVEAIVSHGMAMQMLAAAQFTA